MLKIRTAAFTTIALVALVGATIFAIAPGRGTGHRALRAADGLGRPGVVASRADTGALTAREVRVMAPLAPAPGWAGEIKLGTEDTWEPSIAADPSGPYVYVMYNRFGGAKACKTCPPIPCCCGSRATTEPRGAPRHIRAPVRG